RSRHRGDGARVAGGRARRRGPAAHDGDPSGVRRATRRVRGRTASLLSARATSRRRPVRRTASAAAAAARANGAPARTRAVRTALRALERGPLAQRREAFDRYFESTLRENLGAPVRLEEAICYSALSPGKRLRPLLVLTACEAVGGDWQRALPAAAALE